MILHDPQLQRAGFFFSQQRFPEAERELRQVLSQDPDHTEALTLLAACQTEQHRHDEALQTIQYAHGLRPDDDRILFYFGYVLLHLNREPEAEEKLSAAIQIDPFQSTYFALLAQIRLTMKRYEEALTTADHGLTIDPEDTLCLNVRAAALVKLKRADEAFATIANSLEQEPENSYTHSNFGWTKLESGQYREALDHFREALRLNPENQHAQEGMKEAMKAKNLPYRWFLKYQFWMARLSANYQWGFIIGIYLLYRVILYLAESVPQLELFLLPIIFLYLIFALSSWFIVPLANAALYFDAHGRYALSRDEKITAALVSGSLAVSVLFMLGYLGTGLFTLAEAAFFFFTMTIPFATFLRSPAGTRARRQLYYYTAALVAIGFLALVGIGRQTGELGLTGLLYLGGIFVYQFFANARLGSRY
jgi:tetratricopeptide (TPR) repeat protein